MPCKRQISVEYKFSNKVEVGVNGLMSQISLANLYMMYLSIRTNNQELFFDLMNFSPIAPLKTENFKKIHFIHF